ncbi:DUF6212 domain-containing protein [Falsiroseomonas sp.]|uniref:DUF6212 domain-containing protein n=1 Tax=Falsiroseomonas sp. TaxID=2870721 RepID=UPI003F6F16B4
MTAFLIGAAELAALAAGTPMIVAAPNVERLGLEGAGSLPITVLRPVDGVLRQADGPPGPALPLPPGLRPLASVAGDAASAVALAAGLPPGIPALPATGLLPALIARLVAALTEAEALRGALQRRLAAQPVAAPRRVIDLAPVPTGPAPPPRAMQPLGRGAESLCCVALYLAVPASEAASLLRIRLVAGGRIIGAWTVPGRDLVPGWLALELPEPAPAGGGEAHLEIALDAAAGDRVRIASGGPDAGAPLALRVETAEPGHLRAPRHFDWAMRDLPAPAPGVMLALPEGAWAAATLQGATADRIALGPESPRLLLAIAPGAEARLSLPPLPAGPADLAMLEASLRLGDAAQVEVALLAAPAEATDNPRHSGWRRADAEGRLRVALPLPATPSGAIALRLVIRNAGPAASIEVARLALATGAAGVPRREPEAPLPLASPAMPVAEPPQPRPTPVAEPIAEPVAPPPLPVAAPRPVPVAPPPAAPPPAAPIVVPRVTPPPAPRIDPAAPPPQPAAAAIRIAAIPPLPVKTAAPVGSSLGAPPVASPVAPPPAQLLAGTAPPAPSGPAPSRVMLPGGAPARPGPDAPAPFGGLVPSRGSAFRVTAPQPPLPAAVAEEPAVTAIPVTASPPLPATAAPPTAPIAYAQDAPTSTAWRDLKLNQHLINKEGTYRHLDLAITGLVAPAGLWRQVRTKLFDRRGTVGLEFRSMKGWPQMFDRWPGAQVDNFGPLWRLEHAAPAEALSQLATPHDRALVAAVLEVLPALAARAAATASLPTEDQDAWTERAQRLAAAVAEALRG